MIFKLYKQYQWLNYHIILSFIFIIFYSSIVVRAFDNLSFLHKNQQIKKISNHKINSYGEEIKSSLPWSNAFNFKGMWGTQVDPRTGILSAHIKVGSLLSNLGHGPNIDLEVNYSSNANTNVDELGIGWRWNLTHFNPVTNILVTSTGQSFYLQQNNNGQWYPLYHKLHDIRISGTKKTYFIITYANGLRETLNHSGYETTLAQQNGWCVHFIYKSGSQLRAVSDDEGHSIILRHQKHYINLISKSSEGKSVSVLLNINKNELRKIILPFTHSHNGYIMYFKYTDHLITQTSYPTGLTETFTYNCTDAMKINISKDFSKHPLCVIVKKKVNPGAGQPEIREDYAYTNVNSNGHNYLAFNAKLTKTPSVKDILFEAPVSYTYQTQEDNGIFREIRTFDKYHLLIDDQRISDRTGYKLSEIKSFFCRTDQSDGCARSAFETLPVTYSQPLKIIIKLWSKTSTLPAVATETYHYDLQGRVISHKDAYGRLNEIHYCQEKGDTDCPVEPDGWNLSTPVKSVTKWPVGSAVLSPIITRNYYRKLPNRRGYGYILILDHQINESGKQQLITTRHYYHDKNNKLTYGLLKQTILSGNMQGSSRLHTIIHDYYYQKSSDDYSKTTYSTIEYSTGKRLFSSFITTSLFTNHLLQQVDSARQNTVRYHYDLWDRSIQTDINPGTTFTASMHYQYTISPQFNQLIVTSANGLQSKIIFDGAGRPLMFFREALSSDGKVIAGHWLPVSKITYDTYGRIATQSAYIISLSGKTTVLTKTQTYDDSGRSIRIYLPNGKTIINQYDDAHRCFISYQQSISGRRSAVSVTHANVLYKPTEQWLIPVSHNALLYARELCSHNPDKIIIRKVKKSVITYDGFGRIKTTTDPLEHIVKREYDTLGKLINITGPTGNKVHNVYDLAGNIIQHWAQPVYGGAYLLTSAEYNAAGELLWRAGEDGLHTTFTYTEDGKLSATTTPHGHKISLQYNNHGLPVAQLLDGKIQLQVNYDSVTSQVTTKTDNTGKTFFTYSDDGLPLYLKHTGKNGSLDYKLQWKYDHNRRVVSVTDIGANQTQTLYDSLGRVSEIRYLPDHGTPTTLSAPAYDDFSRIVTIRYGSGMHRKIIYNSFGHPQNISDKLNSTLLSKWSFDYDFNDNITTQIYQATNNQQATLNYKYDALNNLISMTCTGSAKLPLCPRDTAFAGTGLQEAPVITRQDYDFTPLNRISRVHEYLQNSIQNQSLKKTTHYYYADTSVPLRLQRISTLWNNQSLLTKNFNYDIAGNMVADGEGNHIIYNAFNQITQVTQPNGQQSNYSYDGSGREIYNKSYLGVSYLFYRGDHLINERISDREGTSHLIGYQGIAKTIDGMIYQYNENNYRGDVVNILTKDSKNNQYKQNHRNLYSPYGMCWRADKNSLPLYKQTIRGFNGERTDPATGWQFLGAGHRTYNPQQRYFVSEDPVTGGYSFAGNNPVMNSDPSGNMPEWLGSIFKWGSYISSFGLNALHAKWAHIAGAVITSGLTVATLGGLAYTFGGALLGSVVTAGATIAGSIPVVAAAIPANKGLDIAASVTGMTMMASMAATAAIDIGLFFFAEKMIALPEGLELKWLPFNMLKGDCSANKVELFDVRKFIKRLMPDTVKTYFGNSYLYIDSMEELFTLWKHLYSKSKLIQCDSAVIFVVARIARQPVDLRDFKQLLQLKVKFADIMMNNPLDPELTRVSARYINKLSKILFEIHNGDRRFTFISPQPIKDLPLEADQMAIIATPQHIQFVAKFSEESWSTYTFIGEEPGYVKGDLEKVEKWIFPDIPEEERKVFAFMRVS